MNKLSGVLLLLFVACSSYAQVYDDFLGAGQKIGIKVTSSPQVNPDTSEYTISGTSLIPDMEGASRFLSQATLGTNFEEIEYVSSIGIDAWLDEQFAMPTSSFIERYDTIYSEILSMISNDKEHNEYTSYVFYDFVFNDPDILRQKVAFALSQILVVVGGGDLDREAGKLMHYYDILYQNAFGNYRDLLDEVTHNLTMSIYLSYLNNARGDVVNNIFPDENYAREVMQLFSVGLIKLNLDGSPILDSDGNGVPTYDIENIEELAKVFTGLTNDEDSRSPLVVNENIHAVGSKHIFDDVVIPSDQSGAEDIQQCLDAIYNHPNVGPFIGTRLIQQLVKSNPTPAYIKRVAMIFNDNGQGVRGDLKAVVKAILLDPEARNCEWIDHPENGKLIQPIERFVTLFKAFDLSTPTGVIRLSDDRSFGGSLRQSFQGAPSVFNYFTPLHAEEEIIAPLDLLSPEFEILDNITGILYLNEMEDALKKIPFDNRSTSTTGIFLTNDVTNEPVLDFTDEIALYQAEGMEALLDRLDILICRGQLSQRVKSIISNTIEENIENVNNYDEMDIMHDVLYYIFLSSDYVIQK